MIMHGDGHGGIHYHDGLVDINGVFAGRFTVVLTNPPFGQNVAEDQKFGGSEETRVPNDASYRKRCLEHYGKAWEESHNQTLKLAAGNTTILDSFEVGKNKPNRPTEILFLERCIQLLHPGGRMGIVLPDGNLNNPSLSWLRRWAEGKARLLAVVSLPEETFRSAEATVKASLVFLRRFTETDGAAWENAWQQAHAKHDAVFNAERSRPCAEYGTRITAGDNSDLASILTQLESIGVSRRLPERKQAEPPSYPRGVGMTTVGKPRWIDEASEKKRSRALKKQFEGSWTGTREALK
jgi:type I restriction enzyme M protein